jgi:hypothetical protein
MVMFIKGRIRIIKGESKNPTHSEKTVAGEEPAGVSRAGQPPATGAVEVISAWVAELRQKKKAELAAAHAFKGSLSKTA